MPMALRLGCGVPWNSDQKWKSVTWHGFIKIISNTDPKLTSLLSFCMPLHLSPKY